MNSNPAENRLDLRITPEIKQLAMRASALCGSRSLSEFVVQAIREKAARAMEETELLRLQNDAFDAFWAACEDAPTPNEALQAAMRRREQRIEIGEFAIGEHAATAAADRSA